MLPFEKKLKWDWLDTDLLSYSSISRQHRPVPPPLGSLEGGAHRKTEYVLSDMWKYFYHADFSLDQLFLFHAHQIYFVFPVEVREMLGDIGDDLGVHYTVEYDRIAGLREDLWEVIIGSGV